MIAQLHGVLASLGSGAAMIRIGDDRGALIYEVLLPAFAEAQLGGQQGRPVTLHTFHFLESQSQGAAMLPRLAGFLSRDDLRFFQLFTTCKGIGFRKALRAMTLDTGQLAAAIADRDASLLQTLPEIGKRTAETIIVTLRGKVDPFVSAAAYGAPGSDTGVAGAARPTTGGPLAREALEVLLTLGESRAQAIQWIGHVLSDPDDRPADVNELIARVYRVKAGV